MSYFHLIFLISQTFAKYKLDVLPDMTGTKPTYTYNSGPDATNSVKITSCYQCIRAGWIWCSAKWEYSEPSGTYDQASEKGRCCFNSATVNTDRLSYNKGANIVECPASFTNQKVVGAVVSWAISGSYWCSDQAKYMELALMNCR